MAGMPFNFSKAAPAAKVNGKVPAKGKAKANSKAPPKPASKKNIKSMAASLKGVGK